MWNWFWKTDKNLSFRTTPTKIGENWYSPKWEKIKDPKKYFQAINNNWKYWQKWNAKTTNWKQENASLFWLIWKLFK